MQVRDAHRAAVETHVEAVVFHARQAEPAMAAWQAGVHRDPITGAHARDILAHLHHLAGDLVPKHHRLTQSHRAEAAMQIIMQIRSADATSADAHLDVMRPDVGCLPFLDPQVPWRMDHSSFH
jgi:hypothetical protein